MIMYIRDLNESFSSLDSVCIDLVSARLGHCFLFVRQTMTAMRRSINTLTSSPAGQNIINR